MVSQQARNFVNSYYEKIPYSLLEKGVFKFIEKINEKQNHMVLKPLIYMIGYTDLYKRLNYKNINGKLDSTEKICFTLLKNVKTYSKLENLYYLNPDILYAAIQAIADFTNKSLFMQILEFKCLTAEDYMQLGNINTLFQEDLKQYDVDINLDFITEKISSVDTILDAAKLLKEMVEFGDSSATECLAEMVEYDRLTIFDQLKEESDQERVSEINSRIRLYNNKDKASIIKELRVYQIMGIIECNAYYNAKSKIKSTSE